MHLEVASQKLGNTIIELFQLLFFFNRGIRICHWLCRGGSHGVLMQFDKANSKVGVGCDIGDDSISPPSLLLFPHCM